MAHIKNIILYEKEDTKIYINQCIRNFKWEKRKRKTERYAIRRNDNTGLGHFLGGIQWCGRWRQYVFEPEPRTIWNCNCLQGIMRFLFKINTAHRKKLNKPRK